MWKAGILRHQPAFVSSIQQAHLPKIIIGESVGDFGYGLPAT